MTTTIRELVPNLSSALRLIVAGLRDIPGEKFIVRMRTFGAVLEDDDGSEVCCGCAATCALQKLFNKRLSVNNISRASTRASFFDVSFNDLVTFEEVIERIRSKSDHAVNIVLDYWNLSISHCNYIKDILAELPELTNYYKEADLIVYDKIANELEKIGL